MVDNGLVLEKLGLIQALNTLPWREQCAASLRTVPGTEESQTAWWRELQRSTTMRYWAIMDMDGCHVGTCGFTDISLEWRSAEISLIIDPQHRGRGLGHAALKLMLAKGRRLRIRWLFAECYECNPLGAFWERAGEEHRASRIVRTNSKEWAGKMYSSRIYVFDAWEGQ